VLRLPAPRTTRARGALLFAIVAASPLALWMVRNRRVAGMLTGERTTAEHGSADNIWLALDQISRWWLPTRLPAAARIAILALVVAAAVATLSRERRRALARCLIGPAGLFTALYLVALVAAASTTRIDPINARLLAPVFPAIVLGVWTLADVALAGRRRRRLASALLVVWLLYPVTRAAVEVADRYAHGAGGYSRDVWQNADVVHWLRRHPIAAPVVSNEPDALYLLTGIEARRESVAAPRSVVVFRHGPPAPSGWAGAGLTPVYSGRDGDIEAVP
jgi:hypothetical protein